MSSGWRYVVRQVGLLLLVALLACLFLAIGLMVGYSVIGDGQYASSILSIDKWTDLIHKFTGK
ncbi:DNA-directed RNA polymerase subunit beta [Streptococcus uberis]|uniref:DNA-directed RNA polymerase subunit beta n=1 Tax=Streptococcus uberis TaxID=1349 RepID=UPI000542705B|nr:DNA-directed RNA polymerase subunit beta [Streptococcus uberis]KHD41226.1 DNA-directed RNA polymerase subunit beta [Streptococcus hongkongensis]MBI0907406.1 DNA-directed RNA polymerase subunit beta [Streptococcus uberis]MCK1166889.1 DNA-directed RNA polymerase subunit beta [Streptococcus uberis]MCK1217913.1 DNA-directed RNA polymerase subunit beta [Streptococcus uberis]MCK1249239.1 DNA-directed RNA polymerase subunit beta [Streptococcus uberis]